jgi:hypothetical protein
MLRRSLPLLLALWPAAGLAQLQPAITFFDVEHFHPRPMAECSIAVGCAEAGEKGDYRLAAQAFVNSRALVIREGVVVSGGGRGGADNIGDIIGLRSGVQLVAAWAPIDDLELHADVSFVAYQVSSDLRGYGIPVPGSYGVGTPVLGARWTALSQRGGWPIALALALDVMPPLGWQEAMAGNDQWLYEPRLELARWSDEVVVAAELGGVVRQHSELVSPHRLGSQWTAALVASGRSRPLHAEASLRGWWGGGAGIDYGAEVLLALRYTKWKFEPFFMAGPGIRGSPGTVEVRGLVGVGWSPFKVLENAPSSEPKYF